MTYKIYAMDRMTTHHSGFLSGLKAHDFRLKSRSKDYPSIIGKVATLLAKDVVKTVDEDASTSLTDILQAAVSEMMTVDVVVKHTFNEAESIQIDQAIEKLDGHMFLFKYLPVDVVDEYERLWDVLNKAVNNRLMYVSEEDRVVTATALTEAMAAMSAFMNRLKISVDQ